MIPCKDYVDVQKVILKDKVAACSRKPHLVVIQIGADPASASYITGKKKDASELGISVTHHQITNFEDYPQTVVEALIQNYNANPFVDGIIIQLPIPKMLYDVQRLQACISPEKDVDGFRADSHFKPCTPQGIMNWLAYNSIDLNGKEVVVLGRSEIVGRPLVNMMIEAGATVTCCNSKTKDVRKHTAECDILVSAIGKPKQIDSSYFEKDAPCRLIIDVGINRDNNGKLCGDVDYDDVTAALSSDLYVTPVPGSIGLTTRLQLMENTIQAYLNSQEL